MKPSINRGQGCSRDHSLRLGLPVRNSVILGVREGLEFVLKGF